MTTFSFSEKAIPKTQETKDLMEKAKTEVYRKGEFVFRKLPSGKVELIGTYLDARLRGIY